MYNLVLAVCLSVCLSVVQYAVIICLIILLQIAGAILGGVFHSKVSCHTCTNFYLIKLITLTISDSVVIPFH